MSQPTPSDTVSNTATSSQAAKVPSPLKLDGIYWFFFDFCCYVIQSIYSF